MPKILNQAESTNESFQTQTERLITEYSENHSSESTETYILTELKLKRFEQALKDNTKDYLSNEDKLGIYMQATLESFEMAEKFLTSSDNGNTKLKLATKLYYGMSIPLLRGAIPNSDLADLYTANNRSLTEATIASAPQFEAAVSFASQCLTNERACISHLHTEESLSFAKYYFPKQVEYLAKEIAGIRAEAEGYYIISDVLVRLNEFLESKDMREYLKAQRYNSVPNPKGQALRHMKNGTSELKIISANPIDDKESNMDFYIAIVVKDSQDVIPLMSVDIKSDTDFNKIEVIELPDTNRVGKHTIPRIQFNIPNKLVDRQILLDMQKTGHVGQAGDLSAIDNDFFTLLDRAAKSFEQAA